MFAVRGQRTAARSVCAYRGAVTVVEPRPGRAGSGGEPRPRCGRAHRTEPRPLSRGERGGAPRSGRVPRPRPAGGVWRARGRRERRRVERRERGQRLERSEKGQRCRESRRSAAVPWAGTVLRSGGGQSGGRRPARSSPSRPAPVWGGCAVGRRRWRRRGLRPAEMDLAGTIILLCSCAAGAGGEEPPGLAGPCFGAVSLPPSLFLPSLFLSRLRRSGPGAAGPALRGAPAPGPRLGPSRAPLSACR